MKRKWNMDHRMVALGCLRHYTRDAVLDMIVELAVGIREYALADVVQALRRPCRPHPPADLEPLDFFDPPLYPKEQPEKGRR